MDVSVISPSSTAVPVALHAPSLIELIGIVKNSTKSYKSVCTVVIGGFGVTVKRYKIIPKPTLITIVAITASSVKYMAFFFIAVFYKNSCIYGFLFQGSVENVLAA
jgi:hypothetical protein